MNDELKRCANCGHEHRWGILGYSQDGVPLYGPRACYCHCDRFVEAISTPEGGSGNLPAMTGEQTKQLWEQTAFMNAQAPAATRVAVAKMMALGQGKGQPSFVGRLFGRGDGKTALERQWPEFVGFIISQITDIRGAMIRDESKFAHLVSHTDEIVEAMRGVVQLKERLDSMYAVQERILEVLDRLSGKPAPVSADECVCGDPWGNHDDSNGMCLRVGCECTGFTARVAQKEAVRVFASKSAPLWNEPIVADSESSDDNSP